MNKGQFFAFGEDGELHEIGEIKEMEILLPGIMNEQLEKNKKTWRPAEEQITFVIENLRGCLLYNIIPKYMRTELKFLKKKKRGTIRRRRRERKANENKINNNDRER